MFHLNQRRGRAEDDPLRDTLVDRSGLVLRALAAVGFLMMALPTGVFAQSLPVGDALEEYLRVLQVAGMADPGSFLVRPFRTWSGVPDADSVPHPWAEALGSTAPFAAGGVHARLDPVQLRTTLNTGVPFGQNDGALWQGRGVNVAVGGGATVRWGALTLRVHPELVYAQNRDFSLAPVARAGASEYAYPWRPIDLPQRFGPDRYLRLDPGQSTATVTLGGASFGFGTEDLWWGPGIRNAIVMSNNAAGFPHAFVATSHPLDVGIGTVEGQWIWGRLQESEWYLGEDHGQGRLITGAVATFSPSVFAGLTLGAARVFVQDAPPDGFGIGDYLAVLRPGTKSSLATEDNPTGEDDQDQILALQARWALGESGFEVYGEWARNDYSWNLTDFLLEPEHSQGYTLGFRKVLGLSGGRLLSVNAELTHLERSRTVQVRGTPGYYAHYKVLRGYTQRGQIIGAGVGPGGDGQYVGVDMYVPRGRWGLFLQRQVHDNDAFYTQAVGKDDAYWDHDVSAGFGSRAMIFARGLEWEFKVAFMRELNRYFQTADSLWNLHADLTLRWRPR